MAPPPRNASVIQRPPSLSLPLLSLYLRASCRGPPTPPELLDDQHPVVRLLRSFSSDCTGGRPVSLDATLAHHLGQRGPVHGQHRVVCEVLHLRAAASQAPPAQALHLLLPQVFPVGAPATLGP